MTSVWYANEPLIPADVYLLFPGKSEPFIDFQEAN